MSLLRSDQMGYYNIVMPRESAWEILNELGQLSTVQFIDQHPSESLFQRAFSKDVKRTEDIYAQIQAMEIEMQKYQKRVVKCSDIKQYFDNLRVYLNSRGKAEHTYINDVEEEVSLKYGQFNEQQFNYDSLIARYQSLVEYRSVLRKCKEILGDQIYFRAKNISTNPTNLQDITNQASIQQNEESQDFQDGSLTYLAGAIDAQDVLRFKKVIFRATKGNNWTFTSDILHEAVYKGGSFNMIRQKLNRICDSFNASKYSLPQDGNGYSMKLLEIENYITDTRNVIIFLIQLKKIKKKLITMTRQAINSILDDWVLMRPGCNYSYIEELRLFVLKEKLLYHNFNLLTQKYTIFSGYFWCPKQQDSVIYNALEQLRIRKPNIAGGQVQEVKIPEDLGPPTHFRTNDFTAPFQEIVNTYGIPRYREVNPGLFCVSMFPLKFGIMFGDIGHGGALLAFGAFLIHKGKDLLRTPLEGFYSIRYLLALMGFFAFYCGIIYNDFLSLPINLFGTCYKNVGEAETEQIEGCVYPVGFDPKWYIANNELNFFNSYKMKLAVTFGVAQMVWGIFLKGVNCVHFGLWVDLIFEQLPQMVFMFSTFGIFLYFQFFKIKIKGYMCFMFIFKWTIHYQEGYMAPSIINQMINLPLKLGKVSQTGGQDTPLFQNIEFQEKLQYNLLIISVCCVPIMLLVKPLVFLCKPKKKSEAKSQQEQQLLNKEDQDEHKHVESHAAAGHGHSDDFGEIFVHQIIETIEFVLGSISNTASYLRLWALSLAHSQLAKVFFEKTIGGGIAGGSALQVIIGWFIFLNISIAVLMCMDLMECFLHALRLQWVEFQNKFFKADGYKFIPFSFYQVLLDSQNEQQ
ncbi:v-type ATPase 116kda subunit family protein, putative [Ichthyophthirius multifiliis]|uniref:V-type proton ATPase subunit a n=1 Tax=Ichthyophthirius multifiliis TaxID=5932 RepID=G0QUE2_ICHMU|nr:v-type ATPase 116kda subunit family protein, putative [Ichthyophthirius multifiliis]EGR31162.1 v-type ATPase 116kda subunit family protein, putative [Ichthyophthirius multifiliis]|eukprot:XP_004034648.1 v-type ATPase 116kda subunit family protein, putative [Ichthyophthirius multifiliis]